MTHGDLFTGLGGFSLGLSWAGIKTIWQCEIDTRCQDFLRKTWGVPIYDDIKKINRHNTPVPDILTGGFPCQPHSVAGRRRGPADDRFLWPEMFRVIQELHPKWIIAENVPGIDDKTHMVLDRIYSDLEGEGYEFGPALSIPACAVGSPQIRMRYFIVAHTSNSPDRTNRGQTREEGSIQGFSRQTSGTDGISLAHSHQQGRQGSDAEPRQDGLCAEHNQGDMADTKTAGSELSGRTRTGRKRPSDGCGFWDNFVWLPCADGRLRRAPHNLVDVAHGFPMGLPEALAEEGQEVMPHRSILAALGNSVVPQTIEVLGRAIMEATT